MTQEFRPENYSEAQISQWGIQPVKNTPVPCTKRHAGLGWMIDWRTPTEEVPVPGVRFPRAMQPGIWDSTIKGSGTPSFADCPMVFAGVHQNATPTTPGGGTDTRLWTHTHPSSGISDVARYTAQVGNEYYARQAQDVYLNGYTFNFDYKKVDMTVEGEGSTIYDMIAMTGFDQKITITNATGGTFTLNFIGPNSTTVETTSALAFGANAAAVTAALEALPSIGSGGAVATGTLSSGMTVAFTPTAARGMLRADGTLLTGTSTPSIKVAGVANATSIATNQLLKILPANTCVYLDWAYGSIGTTRLEKLFSGSIQVNGVRKNYYTVDCTLGGRPAGSADGRPAGTITLKLMEEWKTEEIRRRFKAGDTAYIRVRNTGALIEGVLYNYVNWDAALNLDGDPDNFGEDQSLLAQGIKMRMVDDPNLGYALRASVQCTLTTLS
jgi:hypothetical protein